MAAPVCTTSPVASGDAVVGADLHVTDGVWENEPIQFHYQWATAGAGIIAGETHQTYTVRPADVGNSVYCQVSGTNVDGTGVGNSNTIGPIGSTEMANVVEVPAYGKTATFIVSEANGYLSREKVIVASAPAGTKYEDGTVMQRGADGRYAPLTATGAAAGLLFDTLDMAGGDVQATVIVRSAECQQFLIKFFNNLTQGQRDAAFAALADQHIVMR